MAHRVFRDASGVEWQVWDVQPQAVEKSDRRRVERRRTLPRPHIPERRLFPDRRTQAADRRIKRRLALVETEEPVRLVFESGTEKRRLTPAPQGWDTLPEDRLCLLCRVAELVRRP